jgi:hypothetical protein
MRTSPADFPTLWDELAPLRDEYYPGSKLKRRESIQMRHERTVAERKQEKADEPWDARPTKVWLQGREYEMFFIGSLAKALGKDAITIRAWMRKGWLPRNSFQTRPIHGTLGDAGRKLWTRRQIEGIVAIAKEEGLLDDKPPQLTRTNFTRRVVADWKGWL